MRYGGEIGELGELGGNRYCCHIKSTLAALWAPWREVCGRIYQRVPFMLLFVVYMTNVYRLCFFSVVYITDGYPLCLFSVVQFIVLAEAPGAVRRDKNNF